MLKKHIRLIIIQPKKLRELKTNNLFCLLLINEIMNKTQKNINNRVKLALLIKNTPMQHRLLTFIILIE